MITELKGKVAVVTGAASGLGEAMARRFARAGMRLVLADIEPGLLEELADSLLDAEVRTATVDVSSGDEVDRLADLAYEQFGAVHVLCNNAGVAKSARTWDLTLDDWKWVLDVDLWGVIHGVRSFVPRMIAGGEPGHVVNTGSMTSLLPMPNLAGYGAAKSAVAAMSETLLFDLQAERHSIGVSLMCPGYIPTRITESDRNRPAVLGGTAARRGSRTTSGVEPTMTADEVAEQVAEAILTDRFWILTHLDYRQLIQDRAARIGTDRLPTVPPVW